MTPEELANARALLPVPIGSGQTIKASGDAAVRRRKVVEKFPELIARIDAQAAQIEALKEKLVEERAMRICHRSNDSVGHWPRYEDMLMDEARRQLKAEMPEVEW